MNSENLKRKLFSAGFFLSTKFERMLDMLLTFKMAKNPPAFRSKNNYTRIKAKLKAVLKAYEKEISLGVSSAFLPARVVRYLFLILVALEFFEVNIKSVSKKETKK